MADALNSILDCFVLKGVMVSTSIRCVLLLKPQCSWLNTSLMRLMGISTSLITFFFTLFIIAH